MIPDDGWTVVDRIIGDTPLDVWRQLFDERGGTEQNNNTNNRGNNNDGTKD